MQEGSNPIPISNCEELHSIRYDPDEYYILTNDIDCADTINWENGFSPIYGFTGTLDGQGYSVKGLYVSRQDKNYAGLFGSLKGATLLHIHLENVTVYGNKYVGALVGAASQTKMARCSVSGDVYLKGGWCWSFLCDSKSGGLVGMATGGTSITESVSHARIHSGSRYQVGGLVGYLRGRAYDEPATVQDCYADGLINGSGYKVGGLVGDVDSGTIIDSYYAGEGKGLLGYDYKGAGQVEGSFYDSDLAGDIVKYHMHNAKATALPSIEMMAPQTFAFWNASRWYLVEGKYPDLISEITRLQVPLPDGAFMVSRWVDPTPANVIASLDLQPDGSLGAWDRRVLGGNIAVIHDGQGGNALKGTGKLKVHYGTAVEKVFPATEIFGGSLEVNIAETVYLPSVDLYGTNPVVFLGGFDSSDGGQYTGRDFVAKYDYAALNNQRFFFICTHAYDNDGPQDCRGQKFWIPDSYGAPPDRWIRFDWFFAPGHRLFARVDDGEWKMVAQREIQDDYVNFTRVLAGWISSYQGGSVKIRNFYLYDENNLPCGDQCDSLINTQWSCTDHDLRNSKTNFDYKGSITENGVRKYDYCLTDHIVAEYYCSEPSVWYVGLLTGPPVAEVNAGWCPNGCNDGKCGSSWY